MNDETEPKIMVDALPQYPECFAWQPDVHQYYRAALYGGRPFWLIVEDRRAAVYTNWDRWGVWTVTEHEHNYRRHAGIDALVKGVESTEGVLLAIWNEVPAMLTTEVL